MKGSSYWETEVSCVEGGVATELHLLYIGLPNPKRGQGLKEPHYRNMVCLFVFSFYIFVCMHVED